MSLNGFQKYIIIQNKTLIKQNNKLYLIRLKPKYIFTSIYIYIYKMSTLENLISETNKLLLWEVLIDELKISNVSQQTLSNISIVFDKNLAIFRNKSSPSDQLMHLNKQFLKIMVIAVTKLFPNLKQERLIKKINISDDNVLYKAEDIQQSRQAQINNLYNQKKEDFEQYTQVNKPQNLDFSDHINEEKITSMDSLLANAMAQRNADLQTIDNTYFNSQTNNNTSVNTWLQSEETSNRTNNTNNNNTNNNTNTNKRLKHINLDDPNNISLSITDETKKKVSWNNEDTTDITNIFSKLKKVETPIEKMSVYETQPSTPLPTINNIPINSVPINNTSVSTPILTNSQIVKQLNEMNAKLDKIFALLIVKEEKQEMQEMQEMQDCNI